MKKIILATILFLANPTFAFCVCMGGLHSFDEIVIEKAYVDANQIFIGKVLKIDLSNPATAKVLFKVEKQYKGEKVSEILVSQSAWYYRKDMWVEDAMPLTKGEKYLVYAEKSGKELLVSGCSRTKSFVEDLPDVKKDIAVLDRIISNPNWKFDEQKFVEWETAPATVPSTFK